MTSASSRTGLALDPNDPEDARIMRRQQDAARKAGLEGRDRAASTRGRADLEAAYDEGALGEDGAPTAAPAASNPGARGRGGGSSGGGRGRFRTMGPGWKAFKPTSPRKLPTRASDAGGFVAGLALYTVAVIYIRYGPAGWKGWLSAKFLNKPMSTGNQSSAGKPTTRKGGTAAV